MLQEIALKGGQGGQRTGKRLGGERKLRRPRTTRAKAAVAEDVVAVSVR